MLASVVGVNRCIEEPHEVIRINTSLIQNTLKWIVNNKIGKVLFSLKVSSGFKFKRISFLPYVERTDRESSRPFLCRALRDNNF